MLQFRYQPGVLIGQAVLQLFPEGGFKLPAFVEAFLSQGRQIRVHGILPLTEALVNFTAAPGQVRKEFILKDLEFLRNIFVRLVFKSSQPLFHSLNIGPEGAKGRVEFRGNGLAVFRGFPFKAGKVLADLVFRILHITPEFRVQPA